MKRFHWIATILVILVVMAGCAKQVNQNVAAPANQQAIQNSSLPVTESDNDQAAEPSEAVSPAEEADKNLAVNNSPAPPKKDSSTTITAVSKKPSAQGVRLLITQNFGQNVILDKTVSLNDKSNVMDILKANVDVTTKWDDSFISGINGLETSNSGMNGQRLDWFYYINGICPNIGACDYELQNGETVWWDYHAWEMSSANSAVIGCYPEPFIHGYNRKISTITIMASSGNQSLAAELEKALREQGAASINIEGLHNEKVMHRSGPTIVVGTWDEFQTIAELDKFNQAYKKTGTGVHFSVKGLELLDYKGNPKQTITGNAGVIAAFGSGLGDAAPLWLIVGIDQNGLEQALRLLINEPAKISGFYSAAVVDSQLIRLPLN